MSWNFRLRRRRRCGCCTTTARNWESRGYKTADALSTANPNVNAKFPSHSPPRPMMENAKWKLQKLCGIRYWDALILSPHILLIILQLMSGAIIQYNDAWKILFLVFIVEIKEDVINPLFYNVLIKPIVLFEDV